MRSYVSIALLLAGTAWALVFPQLFNHQEMRPIPLPEKALSTRKDIRCGTGAPDAVASDCKRLFNKNFEVHYNKDHTYQYWETHPKVKAWVQVYEPYCFIHGFCCISTTRKDLTADDIKKYGKELLKCEDTKKNAVNGRMQIPGGFLCISDSQGWEKCL
ncbi:hypothetical protein BD779DRAFT_1677881 [Infundibulicybe gibba]|nr:hypothetical protein BD779DRAFT_1677881 [Infundibulicybe gibba]